jgi:hypothetical protein
LKILTPIAIFLFLLSLQPDFAAQETRYILDSTHVEIKNYRAGKVRTTRILDILTQSGKEHSHIVLSENRYIRLKKLKARILDMQGKELKDIEDKDIQKLNVSPGFLLYDDAKYHVLDLRYPRLPYRIELCYEKEFESLLFCPSWLPLEDIPVSRSVFELAITPDVKFRTHEINLDCKPVTGRHDGLETFKWIATDLEARIKESAIPGRLTPQLGLLFKPERFEVDDTKGSTESWQQLGLWNRDLFRDRFILSAQAKSLVDKLVAPCKTDWEKTSILYQFLQKHTRYVGIQLGLSGWQPQFAQDVLDNQYGDCKDLSTLMIAMLTHCGIEAFPALVNTERKKIFTTFPAQQFNHVIVCVPSVRDTVWLECTSDYLPAGDLSPGCEDADVLLIKSDGGHLSTTPGSADSVNRIDSVVHATLDAAGTLELDGHISYRGNAAFTRRTTLAGLDAQEKKDRIKSWLFDDHASQGQFKTLEIDHLADSLHYPLVIYFKAAITKYAQRSGSRLFLNPCLLKRLDADHLPKDHERKFPYAYDYAYSRHDTILIDLPQGLTIESMIDTTTDHFSHGEFKYEPRIEPSKIHFVRQFRIFAPEIPAAKYPNYRSFIFNVIKTDRQQMVFKTGI